MPFLNFTPLKSLMYHQSSPFMPFTSFKYLQITNVSLLSLLIILYLLYSEPLLSFRNASGLLIPSVVALWAPFHLSLFFANVRQMLAALACVVMLSCVPSNTALPVPRCRILMRVQPCAGCLSGVMPPKHVLSFKQRGWDVEPEVAQRWF